MHGGNLSKPKSPIFSLGAHGTISDALTYQKRSGVDFVRRKPTPADPRSLPQMYHRWLYQDYVLMWNALTPTQKRVWASLGSRHNRTGLSEFMRDKLLEKEDLAGVWHLDEASGAVAHDSSPNLNHGAIFGASLATGWIDNCRLFDGINDRVTIPNLPVYSSQVLTVMCFIYPLSTPPETRSIISHSPMYAGAGTGWHIVVRAFADYSIIWYDGAGNKKERGFFPAFPARIHVAFTHNLAGVLNIYVNGVFAQTMNAVGHTANSNPLYIGCRQGVDRFANVLVDEVRIYERVLTPTQILASAGRRYPLE